MSLDSAPGKNTFLRDPWPAICGAGGTWIVLTVLTSFQLCKSMHCCALLLTGDSHIVAKSEVELGARTIFFCQGLLTWHPWCRWYPWIVLTKLTSSKLCKSMLCCALPLTGDSHKVAKSEVELGARTIFFCQELALRLSVGTTACLAQITIPIEDSDSRRGND